MAPTSSRDYDLEEQGFLLEEITPRKTAASLLLSPGSSTASAHARYRSRHGGGGAAGRASMAAMVESFTQRFDLALRFGKDPPAPPSEPSDPSDRKAADKRRRDAARAEAKAAREAKRLQLLACKEVAGHAVGSAEVLTLQRLARELCKRPCETYRTAVLRSAAAAAADSRGAAADAVLRRLEAEAEAAAIATVGGAVRRARHTHGGGESGHLKDAQGSSTPGGGGGEGGSAG